MEDFVRCSEELFTDIIRKPMLLLSAIYRVRRIN